MFGAHAAPSFITDFELLTEPWHIVGWPSRANHRVLVPSDVGLVCDLIHQTSVANALRVQPGLREEMVCLGSGARSRRRAIKQVLKELIRKQGVGAQDDLCGSECQRRR